MLKDRQATDALIQDITFEMADMNLVVLNQLTLDDQIYIDSMYKAKLEEGKTAKQIKETQILIHNWKDLEQLADVESTIQTELKNIFGARQTHYGRYIWYQMS